MYSSNPPYNLLYAAGHPLNIIEGKFYHFMKNLRENQVTPMLIHKQQQPMVLHSGLKMEICSAGSKEAKGGGNEQLFLFLLPV